MVWAERLGKYQLLRHLASGGMARVFLARVSGVGGFERHLVLKVMRPEKLADRSFVSMFLDEARLAATLHHQHVAQVYEVGVADDGTYFLAMEYLHGETLRSVLEHARDRRYRLPPNFALTVTAAAASGLHHAHERRGPDGKRLGIIHRDVTPSNVIVGYDGSIKLIDFGIVKAAERSTQTKTGFIKGKAGYMAPEQALGHAIDRRVDVFSLGVVLYELTTQSRAFRAASEMEVARRIVRGDVVPPSKLVADYPAGLEEVVLAAMARDPDERYADAACLGRAIEDVADRLGMATGPAVVRRVLTDLFGSRPEPWLMPACDEAEAHGDDDTDSLFLRPPSTAVTATGAVALARGTGNDDRAAAGEGADPPPADAPSVRYLAIEDADGVIETHPVPPIEPAPDREPAVPTPAARPPAPAAPRAHPARSARTSAPPPLEAASAARSAPRAQPTRAARASAPPPVVEAAATPAPSARATRTSSPPPIPSAAPAAAASVSPSGPTPTPPARAARASAPPPVGKPALATTIPDPTPEPFARLTEPRRSRWMLPVVGGTVAAAVVAVAVVIASSGGHSGAGTAAARDPATALDARPARPSRVVPVGPRRPLAEPVPVPDPNTVRVRVTTDPPDATVVLDGERLGPAPIDVHRPRSEDEVWIKVRKRGFLTRKVRVSLGTDVDVTVPLPAAHDEPATDELPAQPPADPDGHD